MPRLDIVAQQNHLYPYCGISFGKKTKENGGSLFIIIVAQLDLETTLCCSLNLKGTEYHVLFLQIIVSHVV